MFIMHLRQQDKVESLITCLQQQRTRGVIHGLARRVPVGVKLWSVLRSSLKAGATRSALSVIA